MASAAVHRNFVKLGLLSEDLGKIYDWFFHDRQKADFIEFVSFVAEDVGAPSTSLGLLLAPFGGHHESEDKSSGINPTGSRRGTGEASSTAAHRR